MGRGRNRKKASRVYSPCHLDWDPLDLYLEWCCLEPEDDVLGSWWTGFQGMPPPQAQSAAGNSAETLEWIRQCRQEFEPERLQREWIPLSEWGWCEWCLGTRHIEAVCAHTGPEPCCCCVFPEEEDQLRCELHGGSGHSSVLSEGGLPLVPSLGATDAGFPPPLPVPVVDAGPVAGPALLAPGPLPALVPPRPLRLTDGSMSWGGVSGLAGGGVGPEEDPAEDSIPAGSEDGSVAGDGRGAQRDTRPPLLATPAAPQDCSGHRTGEAGQEPGVDTVPECPGPSEAAAPGGTPEHGPVPTCAAAPLGTSARGQGLSGGWTENTGASTAAAPSAGPECSPGLSSPAAPPAAEESGPKIFAATSRLSTANPAAPTVCRTPSPSTAVAKPPPSSPSSCTAATPCSLAVVTSGSLPGRKGTRPTARTSVALLRQPAGRTEVGETPPPSLCLELSAPDTRFRLTHDPGG